MGEVATRQVRSLKQNIRSALGGNSIYALCQFGMLSILALTTSPTEVGRYALALAITAPVFLFAGLKLRQVQVTDAANDYSFGEYLAQRLITSIVASTAILLVAGTVGMETRTYATVIAVTALKAFESVIDILYGAMQRREQLHLVARSQMWRGVGGLLLFAGVILLTRQVELAAASLAVYSVGQAVTNLLRVRKLGVSVAPTFSLGSIRRLTWLALPLGAAVSVSSLAVNVPRYFIETIEGTAQLGIFAALAYLLTVTGMVMASVGEAASPRLANLYSTGEYGGFRSILVKLVLTGAALGLTGVLVAVVAGEFLLGVIYGPEYAAGKDVLIVLMTASAILSTTAFLGTALNAMRRFTVQMPINMVVLIAVSAASWFAVPTWGIMGGAWAMVAGELASVAFYVVLIFRILLPATAPSAPLSKTGTSMLSRITNLIKDTTQITRDPVGYARRVGVSVGKDCRLIGLRRAQFGSEPYLISIGNHVTIAGNVSFTTHDGGVWVLREKYPHIDVFGKITIEDNVFVGMNATILPGVTIGRDSIVAAGALVNRDVPAGSVVAGVPAKVVSTIEEYEAKALDKAVHVRDLPPKEKQAAILAHLS